MKRLAIVTTHPIQYYAPLFRLLLLKESGFSVMVFYTLSQAQEKLHDPDFGLAFEWDVPLLEGYEYTFVQNTSANPGTRSFRGIINPTLIGKMREWKPDAVLVFGWAFVSHLQVLRYFHGKVPVLFRGDSNLLDEPSGFSAKTLLRRIFLKWVYAHINYALYVGEANRQYYLAHGLKPARLFFAPHAIDNSRFMNNAAEWEAQAAQWRLGLKIAFNEIVFLFAAKLTAKKEPVLLIEAFISLNEPDTRLIIVGNGELEAELKDKYKSVNNVLFIPFQNQSRMPVVYHLANVFVLPSKGPGETWGLAVNEAMACGRAVIVSDKCGCAQDLVQHGENGYIFESGNLESLKNCMKCSLTNYQELGTNACKTIKHWSYSQTVDQLKNMSERNLL